MEELAAEEEELAAEVVSMIEGDRITLDSIGSTSDSPYNFALSNSNGSSKSAEIKGTISNDALKGALKIPKHADRAALSKTLVFILQKARTLYP
nr:hypothetical protein CFP56_08508 [Quercus suber]